MKFGSVCSGIEAASVAWGAIGWRAAWLSEIEPFPSAVLAHHYPDVPNLGDMTKLPERIRSGEVEAPDVFCGGTPCQAFSVAGLRKSLDDARGNLSLTFCEIANELDAARLARGEQPTIVFWENVPGVLNTKDNAFGCFLTGLAGEDDPLQPSGGKWTNAGAVLGPKRAVAWRVLDAQYFGVAQRRRRVFVVASARDGFDPCAVLFEFDGVRRDTAPSRKAGQDTAGTLASRTTGGGFPGTDEACSGYVQPVIMAHGQGGAEVRADGGAPCLTCNHEAPIVFDPNQITSPDNRSNPQPGAACHTLPAKTEPPMLVSMRESGQGYWMQDDIAGTLRAEGENRPSRPSCVIQHAASQVRRLTPTECERLQGFPDGYTAIPWRGKDVADCPDGPRYKALGNSWAVPNVRWIGERIVKHLNGEI